MIKSSVVDLFNANDVRTISPHLNSNDDSFLITENSLILSQVTEPFEKYFGSSGNATEK